MGQIKLAMSMTNGIFCNDVVANRNFSALDQVYTTDARILPPGAPMVSGRADIKKFWVDLIESADVQSATLESVDVVLSGDGVVEIGRASLTAGDGQATAGIEVKYVVYWRQEDGRWKWHVDIWNQNS